MIKSRKWESRKIEAREDRGIPVRYFPQMDKLDFEIDYFGFPKVWGIQIGISLVWAIPFFLIC